MRVSTLKTVTTMAAELDTRIKTYMPVKRMKRLYAAMEDEERPFEMRSGQVRHGQCLVTLRCGHDDVEHFKMLLL